MPTGTVTKVSTDPRSAIIHDPTTPPIGGTDYTYTDLSVDQYQACLAAWGADKSVKVTGTAPTATKVESA